MQAIGYLRWSSDEQSQGDSETRQRNIAEEACKRHGWTLDEVVIDSGKSAFHGKNRAEGGALLEIERRAEAGALAGRVLIIENTDRLSRGNPLESLNLINKLSNLGLAIWVDNIGQLFTKEKIAENWMTLLTAYIPAGLGHQQSKDKSDRLKSAWRKMRETGTTKTGTADPRVCPTWIEIVDGEYQVIEERAGVIRWIFEQCAEGKGLNAIARELNANAEKTRWNKGVWTQSNLGLLLRKRNVLGEYMPHEMTPEGRQPVGDWQAIYPAVVSKELWHQVQAGLDSRRSSGGPKAGFSNVLQRFSYCGECGSRLVLKTVSRMQAARPSDCRTLLCQGYHRGKGCWNGKSVLYRHVLNALIDHALPFAIRLDEEPCDARDSIALQEAELVKAQEGLARLVDLYSETGSASTREGILRAEARIGEARRALTQARLESEKIRSQRPLGEIAREIHQLREGLASCADTRRKVNALLSQVVDGVWWSGREGYFTILVAGVNALRFNKEGELLQEVVATSALIDEAGRRGATSHSSTAPSALEKWEAWQSFKSA